VEAGVQAIVLPIHLRAQCAVMVFERVRKIRSVTLCCSIRVDGGHDADLTKFEQYVVEVVPEKPAAAWVRFQGWTRSVNINLQC
jgi:hypothetical protein